MLALEIANVVAWMIIAIFWAYVFYSIFNAAMVRIKDYRSYQADTRIFESVKEIRNDFE